MRNISDRKIRFAILGCSRISIAHLDAIKSTPNAELAAICDIIEESVTCQAAYGYR